MIKFTQLSFILALTLFCFFLQPVFANNTVSTDVKVILASTGDQEFDPGLEGIIHELQSVFKYTSYRLLSNQRFTLQFNQAGLVNLPGDRTLIVRPSEMDGKRIQYHIDIQKSSRSIFQTQVLLKDKSSITIGGPQLDDDVLLINIFGRFQ